jgi:hypothetical protein
LTVSDRGTGQGSERRYRFRQTLVLHAELP